MADYAITQAFNEAYIVKFRGACDSFSTFENDFLIFCLSPILISAYLVLALILIILILLSPSLLSLHAGHLTILSHFLFWRKTIIIHSSLVYFLRYETMPGYCQESFGIATQAYSLKLNMLNIR